MAYTDAQTDPRARAGSMLVVGGIHAAVGLGLVAALSVTISVAPPVPNPTGVLIESDPLPPPPEPVEAQQDPVKQTSHQTAPEPLIDLTTPSDIVITLPPLDPPMDTIRVPTPPRDPIVLPPRPGPTFSPTAPVPRNAQNWISTDDYPARDLRLGHEGTARYRVVVDSSGRVNACEITASTGHAGLDRATCTHIERRARFDPAKNGDAKPSVGSYSGVVTWQIPN